MTKRFIQDNRGQVLYAVIITIMFVGLLSMIAMGLTLKNYQAAQVKQQHVKDYYAADAVAELIRTNELLFESDETEIYIGDDFKKVSRESPGELSYSIVATKKGNGVYEIVVDTVTLSVTIEDQKFTNWEVSYHAVQTEAEDEQPSN